MAVVDVLERVGSRPLTVDPKGSSGSREYWVRSNDLADDTITINDAVALVAPDSWLGFVKKSIKSTPQGGGFWFVVVEYGLIEGQSLDGQDGVEDSDTSPPQVDSSYVGPEVSFSTGGGTQHITRSISTISSSAIAPLVAPDYSRAIGVVDGSNVTGVDIVARQFEWSLTRRIAFITPKYMRNLASCTGKVNIDEWRGFAPGELLFMGCEAKFDGDLITNFSWLVTFKFAVSNNEHNIQIADGLTVESKLGWDYLWVGFVEKFDAVAGRLVSRPTYAYVEQVYKQANFRNTLGFA